MTVQHTQVPPALLARVRACCLGLPETVEETAWTGIRWRVRRKTFVHVLMIDNGWPAAYAAAAGHNGPVCVLTFRSPLPEFEVHAYSREPYFRPRWFADIVGVKVDATSDWDEIAGLVAVSHCHLAPGQLADRVRSRSG